MWTWFYKLASPPHFYRVAGRLLPWFGWPAAVLIVAALYGGLVLAPADYQQGDAYRIIYMHAPSAWMSLFIYVLMAVSAAIGLIWRMKLAHAVAASAAPIGASFTFAALVTGALWGQPMWGTWWVWDARLTSELILLFLYFGYIALRASIDDLQRADRASAVLAIIGVINVPIIHYSVVWWNSLHQVSSVTRMGKPTIDMAMLIPLLMMFVAFNLYFVAVLLRRVRGEVVRRERNAEWIRAVPAPSASKVDAAALACLIALAALGVIYLWVRLQGIELPSALAMGKYGDFVWPTYLLTLGVLCGNVVLAGGSHGRATVDARRRANAMGEIT